MTNFYQAGDMVKVIDGPRYQGENYPNPPVGQVVPVLCTHNTWLEVAYDDGYSDEPTPYYVDDDCVELVSTPGTPTDEEIAAAIASVQETNTRLNGRKTDA